MTNLCSWNTLRYLRPPGIWCVWCVWCVLGRFLKNVSRKWTTHQLLLGKIWCVVHFPETFTKNGLERTKRTKRTKLQRVSKGSVSIHGLIEGSVSIHGLIEGSVWIHGLIEGPVWIHGLIEGSVWIQCRLLDNIARSHSKRRIEE